LCYTGSIRNGYSLFAGLGLEKTKREKKNMPILTFPDGKQVNVEFDEIAHSYVVAHKLADNNFSDYRPTHGITAPLAVVPKPFLKPWAAKEATHATLHAVEEGLIHEDQITQFFADLKSMDDNERYINEKGKDSPVMSYYRFTKLYPWYKKVKKAYEDKSNDSKELGHWLHSSIEIYYKSNRETLPVVTPFVENMWTSFITFDNFFRPKPDPDGLEFIVYSMMFGYSGQGDFRGQMNGKTCIGDWKTTNRFGADGDGIDVEYFFQVGGLAQAEYERTGVWVEDLFIANFDKKGGEPRVVWASDFGMSPQDCARAYVSCFNTYHTIENWDYKFSKR
jgi:hypothetical protein